MKALYYLLGVSIVATSVMMISGFTVDDRKSKSGKNLTTYTENLIQDRPLSLINSRQEKSHKNGNSNEQVF